jgi:ribose-phosphate pyrophosphokinase
LKWEGDWLFTLKSVAKMINERNFKKVMTLDPHSMATTALIDRLVVHTFDLSIILRFRGWDKNYKGVIAPDLGAEKRAEDVAKQFNVPVFHATKQRDPVTNKLSGFKMLDRLIPAAHYLVVDDLCDAGGTFVGLADSIKNVYAVKLDLYVTHGLFTKGTTALEQRFEDIFATDSVTTNNPPVKTIEVVKGMALNA